MTIARNTNLPQPYIGLRSAVKRLFEGFDQRPYLDTAQSPNPTVGIGFNLRDANARGQVLFELGFRLRENASPAERAYIDRIAAAVNASYTKDQTAELQVLAIAGTEALQ